MKLRSAFFAAALLAAAPAQAAQNSLSTPTSGPMSMATFAGSYLNPALQTLNTQWSGNSAPGSPVQYQFWMDTATSPPTWDFYDGTSWVPIGTLNTSTHVFAGSVAISAAKWTTARNLAGNSVDGSANVAFANKFVVQGTTDSGLSGAQFLGALGTGIVKNTTTTGVLSIAAAGTDYLAPSGSGAALTGITWSQIGSTPTTLAGYGITNGATNGANSNITSLSGLTTPLSVAQGGSGSATPALVAGTNITITGSWPNQTVAASGGGSGSVTSVSVVSANGFAGSVANATTTPAITISTSVTGLLKGNGTAISAATAGTDYLAPASLACEQASTIGFVAGTNSSGVRTANNAAWTAWTGALPATGGCIQFGAGVYYFASALSYTLPSGYSSIWITGAGSNTTILDWPSTTNGIALTAGELRNSFHIRDLTLTTGQVSAGGDAISLTGVGSQSGIPPTSDIANVEIRGDDYTPGTVSGTHYWGVGIYDFAWGSVNIYNVNTNGPFQNATGAGGGVGIQLGGTPYSSGCTDSLTLVNIKSSSFNFHAYGMALEDNWQGVTVDATNFNGTVGSNAIIQAGGAGCEKALLDITNSQFNYYGPAQIDILSGIDVIQLANDFITIPETSGVGFNIDAAAGAANITIQGTFFNTGNYGSNPTGTTAINIAGSEIGGSIAGNTFRGLPGAYIGTGVSLGSSTSEITEGPNSSYYVTTPVSNSSTTNNVLDLMSITNTGLFLSAQGVTANSESQTINLPYYDGTPTKQSLSLGVTDGYLYQACSDDPCAYVVLAGIGLPANTVRGGLVLQNTIVPSHNNQSFAPAVVLKALGWDPGTSTGKDVEWQFSDQPVETAGEPTSNLYFTSTIDGTSANAALLTSAGNFSLTENTIYRGFSVGNNSNTVAQLIGFNSSGDIGALKLFTSGTANIQLVSSGTVSFINTGQNFCIGATSCSNPLSVTGNASVSGTLTAANINGVYVGLGGGAITSNTASGVAALQSNTTGNSNTASGLYALQANTTGNYNTASGAYALQSNTTGAENIGIGYGALVSNTTGSFDTASGVNALYDLGSSQTAGAFVVGTSYTIASIGTTDFTLVGAASNTVGVIFTATGVGSGTGTAAPQTNQNTAVGYNTGRGIVAGQSNTILGANVTGLSAALSNSVILATGDGTIRADFNKTNASGWTFPGTFTNSGIASTAQADVVCTTSSGLLTYQVSATGCAVSSIRFKQDVRGISDADALQTVVGLKSEQYHYKPGLNMGDDIHFGFIAEQVETIDKDLVTYEDDGQPHAVKYNELTPFIAGAIRQLKADNDNMKAEIADLKRRLN